jgi:endonuclease YncB( thermonuclease family)
MKMKRVIAVVAACVLALAAFGKEITGKVTRVSDGDTLWVSDSLGRHKVRLNRIDAPESDQPYGKESAAHLKSLIGGKVVRVEYTSTDQYGRILGIIFLGDIDINLQMVKDGCAWHYKHFDKTQSYADAEAEARAAKRGLWASGDAINPYQWRKSKR